MEEVTPIPNVDNAKKAMQMQDPSHPRHDPIAVEERRAAIKVVMARVVAKREQLSKRIQANQVNVDDARLRNKAMPGYLGELWTEFLELPSDQQVEVLNHESFKGMAWQSLLQCSPYF